MIKPYYQDDWVIIYNGDCLEVMKEFYPETIWGYNCQYPDLTTKYDEEINCDNCKYYEAK